MNLVYLKKHWFCYMIWRERRRGGRCLSPVSHWICGLNLETLLVWYMIKRSLWRTHNFKGSTQTVEFQSSSQSLISSPFHKLFLMSLTVYPRIISRLIVWRRDKSAPWNLFPAGRQKLPWTSPYYRLSQMTSSLFPL